MLIELVQINDSAAITFNFISCAFLSSRNLPLGILPSRSMGSSGVSVVSHAKIIKCIFVLLYFYVNLRPAVNMLLTLLISSRRQRENQQQWQITKLILYSCCCG